MRQATRSLEALLVGLFDYAGLFPPAKLSMVDAVREYAGARALEHAWMGARFCCPPSRFAEFAAAAAPLWGTGEPWRVAAIGTAGANADVALAALDSDLEEMKRLAATSGGRAIADALEAKLPLDVAYPGAGSPTARRDFLRRAGKCVVRARPTMADVHRTPTVYWEFPLLGQPNWEESLRSFAASVSAWNATEAPKLGLVPFALKIRTGGLEASAFPTTAQVAGFIAACRDAEVAFKATAGLHHPIRHFAASTSCDMHGFLNLFVAATLAQANGIDEATIEAILSERDASAFRFDDAGLAWRGERATVREAAAAREKLAISIGSCSFAEPVEDLHALRLLAPAAAAPRP